MITKIIIGTIGYGAALAALLCTSACFMAWQYKIDTGWGAIRTSIPYLISSLYFAAITSWFLGLMP